MTHPEINAELMLRAANTAFPNFDFAIVGNEVRQKIPHSPYFGRCFNPLTSDSDARALERALKKAEWLFCYVGPYEFSDASGDQFSADHYVHDTMYDPSDTLLLLKCVSKMTGLPLHAKGVEG